MRYLLFLPLLAAVMLGTVACKGDTTVNVPAQGNNALGDGITVSGSGEVNAPPDILTLSIGIEAEGRTVALARTEAAAAANRLIDSLKANGVAEKDIQTTSVNIYPQYFYSPNEPPRITAYTASNTLSVKVRDIDRAGKVIDDGVDAAGDTARLQGIAFGVDDPAPLLKQAREKAVADARSRAEAYAAAAGVNVGDVLSIAETNQSYVPVIHYAADDIAGSEKSTPIEPGETTVSVNVNVRFAIKR